MSASFDGEFTNHTRLTLLSQDQTRGAVKWKKRKGPGVGSSAI